MPDNDVPKLLSSNGWCGNAAATGGVSTTAAAWASRKKVDAEQYLPGIVTPPPSQRHWQDPTVGWGVVLPDRDDLDDAQKARGADAPECIRELIHQRADAPIYRYRFNLARQGKLRRYFTDRSPIDLNLAGARGTGTFEVPRYLLIVGSPTHIPWSFQYRLQTQAFVGRLDLDPEGLDNYVKGLMSDWNGSSRTFDNPVLWAVNHGHPDITHLMAKTIAEKMQVAFKRDGFNSSLLTGGDANLNALYEALKTQQPAFVLTASHGATFPLDSAEQLRSQLGLLVDVDYALLNVQALQQSWNPTGAIWYAHACCSAGADQPSAFRGLVDENSSLGIMLEKISAIGPQTASLPRQLLGSAQPLGAFVGHIEPTFDWTLRDPQTGQVMTEQLIMSTLFRNLHVTERQPIAMAMDAYYSSVAGLLLDHVNSVLDNDLQVIGAKQTMLKAKLLAMDRLAMVTLGDPTVCLPV